MEGQYHPGGFADWSTPEFVIISGNRNLGDLAAIESVKQSYRLRGAEVLHTAEDGCIRVEIGVAGLRTTTFRPHVRATPAALATANFSQAP